MIEMGRERVYYPYYVEKQCCVDFLYKIGLMFFYLKYSVWNIFHMSVPTWFVLSTQCLCFQDQLTLRTYLVEKSDKSIFEDFFSTQRIFFKSNKF